MDKRNQPNKKQKSPMRFIWSNRMVLLLRGSLVWYANYVVSYKVLNSLLKLGLINLAQWFRSLA